MIENARGEFIAFFDDDDVSFPDRVSRQVARILEYEDKAKTELVLCFGGRTVVLPGETSPVRTWEGIGHSPTEPHGSSIAEHLLGVGTDPRFTWGAVGCGTMMARRRVFQDVGDFDESIRRGDGWDYAMRLGLMGGHCIAVRGPIIQQYITATPDKAGRIKLDTQLALVRKYKAFLCGERHYAASAAILRSWYYGNEGQTNLARVFYAAALLLAPHRAREKLRFRRMGP
jgi:hypothetical protein